MGKQRFENLIDEKMTFFDKIRDALYPENILKTKTLLDEWEKQKKDAYYQQVKIASLITGVLCLLFIPIMDVPSGFIDRENLLVYRLMVGFSFLASSLLYWSNFLYSKRYYKLTSLFFGLLVCYFQIRTLIVVPEIPNFVAIFAIFVVVLLLKLPFIQSSFVYLFILLLFWHYIKKLLPGVGLSSNQYLFGYSSIGMMAISIIQYGYHKDVLLFLVNKKLLLDQEEKIKLKEEMLSQLKAFFPKRIFEELIFIMEKYNLNMVMAIDEIMRPRKRIVSCCYTDIRNFTTNSKSKDSSNEDSVNENFLNEYIFNNIYSLNEIIELNRGIPRNIGDLIFSFFYNEKFEKLALLDCLISAMEMAKKNVEMNLVNNVDIKRYIIISHGEAFVGNVGGVNGSRDITVLGPPANICDRIDKLTKEAEFQKKSTQEEVVLTEEVYLILNELFKGEITFKKIVLGELILKIRNFEDIKEIYTIHINYINQIITFRNIMKDKWCLT